MLTAAQGGTCTFIHTECCTFILEASENISLLLNDLKTQVQNLKTQVQNNADAYTIEVVSQVSDWFSNMFSWIPQGIQSFS